MPSATLAGFVVAILAIGLMAVATYRTLRSRTEAGDRVTHALQVLQRLDDVLSSVKDAETGQRGFLLTGDESYLVPYTNGKSQAPADLNALRTLTAGDPDALRRVDTLQALTTDKFEELADTIARRRAGDEAGALAIVRTDRGKASMDRIRDLVGEFDAAERDELANSEAEWQTAITRSSVVTWGGSSVLLVLMIGAAVIMSRDYRAANQRAWVRLGQMGLTARLQGEHRLDALGERVLAFLAGYLGAPAGAIYIAEQGDRFRRFGTYALDAADEPVVRTGEGLLGQAAKENRTLHVTQVPPGYVTVASSVGRASAAELLIAPASADGIVQAVVELAFFRRVNEADRELLDRASEALGVAVRTSKDRTRLEDLLEETQRQAEELQMQQEELRVSNEELEEQSRALRESQTRLEMQQTELEQVNTQLEEQTQVLEHQRDELATAEAALVQRAADLARASQYKSEFLANMSHELRTPLNSSLILAKLLADNKGGNLTDEQVKFALTIHAAGKDLLALINDILDLSKIEAGKVDLSIQPVPVARAADAAMAAVKPLGDQKGLACDVAIDPGTPETIGTDAQRLGQILRNLLSNAVKFTDAGTVTLRVFAARPGTVSFAVRDTGIGVPRDQQDAIFEAFRQADGSTHRKYGGTGLGLSISRDLARLLGGDIAVESAPGQGSTFTLTLPEHAPAVPARQGQASAAAAARAPTPLPPFRPVAARPAPVAGIDDDRHRLRTDGRRVLVIEDDIRFAAVLRDLAHEMGFQCLVTHSAADGVAAARSYQPQAILLDIKLPDHSGLGVLDQLKRTPETRHIPVHVVSVVDVTHRALEYGAIGYALKPVDRETLVEAFRRLEAKLAQGLRRVLVVEDDERQRESIRALLAADDVEITAVGTAREALAHLTSVTFDCVVLDLKLPDFSGRELLEQMAVQEHVSFPPVIVYTGRSLTPEEEQDLGRFSKSIIIKDARSPERLLDEVTLFLHQVEARMPPERQRMLRAVRDRDAALEHRRVLVVEDDARNIFALASVLEPKGVRVEIARNGREAIETLARGAGGAGEGIDLVLMDIMMPEMDGLTAIREIRTRPEWKKLPIIALTAKAMPDDHDNCLDAGANDYIAKPLDVEKLLSLIRVWMPA